ncbi:MAG: AAA family ATPase [Phenylobacterium sp.]
MAGNLPPTVIFSDPNGPSGSECTYSIIIGNNGSGKSRLLGNIASDFASMYRAGSGRDRYPRLGCLEYLCNEARVALGGRPIESLTLEELEAPTPLPARVIAVALTPVDKFPLEPSSDGDDIPRGEFEQLRDGVSFYHYVGMRDRTNRASVVALLYRALEGLGGQRTAAEAARLRGVFELLGYEPRIRAKLKATIGRDVQAFLQGAFDLGEAKEDDTRLLNRLRNVATSGAFSETWLREKLAGITPLLAKQGLEFDLRFGDETPALPFDGEALRLLRRLGALSLSSIDVWRSDGTRHDLREASSGEISILTVFLSIAAHLRDGSLVLVDEPETSLHPEWQSKYVHLMREVFAAYSGCHFVFSTHSPLIVADLPERSWVYSMDRASSVSTDELLGRSPDYVMARAFDVISPTNFYLRDVLAEALRLVGERQIQSPEFDAKLSELVRLASNMDGGEQIKEIVKDLQVAKDELATDGD